MEKTPLSPLRINKKSRSSPENPENSGPTILSCFLPPETTLDSGPDSTLNLYVNYRRVSRKSEVKKSVFMAILQGRAAGLHQHSSHAVLLSNTIRPL
jgi:hypothetical protein